MVTCYIEEHEVLVHMFYNDKQAALEKEAILKCVYEYEKTLRKFLDENKDLSENDLKKYSKWFRFKTESSTKIVYDFVKKINVIEEELKKCARFQLLPSKKMEPNAALDLYMQTDGPEKLFITQWTLTMLEYIQESHCRPRYSLHLLPLLYETRYSR